MLEAAIVMTVLALFLMWGVATAPMGWEDEDGFHWGEPDEDD